MTQKIDEKEIFDVASTIDDTSEREAYLDSICGSDGGLRRRMSELLSAHTSQTEFLAGRSPVDALTEIPNAAPTELGSTIGRYKILEQIGEGGFGVVYMAEQKEPIRRKVALKIIKPGMDTNEIIGRFEAERQALAMMDHPNIAKVLDAGTTDTGRPYFVMELVRGSSIVEFCDDNNLSLRERLELFIPVCQAIQHAHQKAIIHRDIKPTNVLVTMHDDKAVPKVIDFGIAKALHAELTARTVFTQFRQLIGTPSYMSPEQAQMSGLDVDTRCDVYALGVVLYELLTGATPFDPKELLQGGYDEICRRIREQEPPRPSNRVSTMDGVSRRSAAKSRKADPDKLGLFMRGDLDWVVMKALEKDRTRRYQTVNEFGEDVQRYLSGDAVLACPPTIRYKVTKFVRRNRARVAITAAFLMMLCLSSVVAWALYADARIARDKARSSEDQANSARQIAEDQKTVAEQRRTEAVVLATEIQRHLRSANVRLLAAQSQALKLESPVTSVLLAAEAVKQSQRYGENLQPLAYEGLVSALRSLGGEPLSIGAPLHHTVASPDGSWVAAARTGGSISIDIVRSGVPPERVAIPKAHDGRIRAMAVATDGTLYSAAGDGIRSWTVGDNGRVEAGNHIPCQATSLAISPDGKWMAAGTWSRPNDRTVRRISIWKLDDEAKDPTITIEGLRSGIHELHFTPDCKQLVTKEGHEHQNHKDMILRVWEVETGKEKKVLHGPQDWVTDFVVSPNGRWVASGGYDGAVRLWDLESAASGMPGLILTETQLSFESLAISPDSRWLAAGCMDAIHVWDLGDPDPLSTHHILYGPAGEVGALAFTPDAKRLISGSSDRAARVWHIGPDERFAPQTTLRGHESAVAFLETDPEGRWVVTGSADGVLRRWDFTAHDLGSTYPDTLPCSNPDYEAYHVADLVVSEDGQWLGSADLGNGVRLWPVDDLTSEPDILFGHTNRVLALAFASSGRHVFSAGADGSVRRWDLNSKDRIGEKVIQTAGSPIKSIAISGDSSYILVRKRDGRVALWQQRASQYEFVDEIKAGQMQLAAHSGGLYTGNNDGELIEWRATPTCLERVGAVDKLDAGISALSLNTQGSLLAVAAEGDIRLYRLAGGKLSRLRELIGTSGITELEFSPDGTWLYAGHDGRVLEGWDLGQTSNSPAIVIRGHEFKSIAILPDGRRLVSGGRNKTPRVWTLRPDDLLEIARQRAGKELMDAELRRFSVFVGD